MGGRHAVLFRVVAIDDRFANFMGSTIKWNPELKETE
jgi:hypothetical protein